MKKALFSAKDKIVIVFSVTSLSMSMSMTQKCQLILVRELFSFVF